MKYLFTSESVTRGHPDKICDYISDSILDAYLEKDENSRVAIETAIKNNNIFVLGEVTSNAIINIENVIKNCIKNIGYTKKEYGFSYDNLNITVDITKQSPDISMGVNKEEIGAGDQGIMFGYATNETDIYLPYAYYLATMLVKRLEIVRTENIIPYLRPDGKGQVTIEYESNKINRIHTILVSTQHDPDISYTQLKEDIKNHVIKKVMPDKLIDEDTIILINPTGNFVIGGPVGDAGVTGRKIIVDTYGGYARHGGGAFSGKDYTKVDRSAAYYARYVAKNLVAAKIADKIEIQVGYAIGLSKPVSLYVDTFDTSKYSNEEIINIINMVFDFTVSNIIKEFSLQKVKYSNYSVYGHFGTNSPWEKLDKVKEIEKIINAKTSEF